MPEIPYHIKKSMFKETIHYRCPKCKGDLESKLEEAGSNDFCPLCGEGFVVPGSEEVERRKAQKTALARVKKSPPPARAQSSLPVSPPPRAMAPPIEVIDAEIEEVLLAPAPTRPSTTPSDRMTELCPYCKEEIVLGAKKCKHCSEYLDKSVVPPPSAPGTGVQQQPQPILINNQINMTQSADTKKKDDEIGASIAAGIFLFLMAISCMVAVCR